MQGIYEFITSILPSHGKWNYFILISKMMRMYSFTNTARKIKSAQIGKEKNKTVFI